MARVLLDTTVLIDALRGRAAVQKIRDLHIQRDVPLVCGINIEEVVRGLRPEERAAADRLLNGLFVAPLGREQGERAGAWRRDYAGRGITLSQSDCLVAAAALGVGARLATGNPKHFPMREVAVEHWPVGY
ncbi:MAG: PIN domain-containing protein [Candidatus Dormibacteraceae bacterium]